MSLMKGRSYSQGARANKLAMEAFFRLVLQAFVRWLNAEPQEAFKSTLYEEHIATRIKLFQLAIKEKERVPSTAKAITTELQSVMKLFEDFRRAGKSRSHMFAFWDEYVTVVLTLLQFIKAEWTGNWSLHLEATSKMVPQFFALDRPNYTWWLSAYLADMAKLEQKHPEVYKQFMDEDHAISHSSQPFAKVWTDMALKQSINLNSKSKGSIVGISQNPDALQRWFLTSHERASITTAVKQMCGISDPDRVGTHKEAVPKRIQHDEKNVQAIVDCFTSGLVKDPFSEDNSVLSNIARGVVLPAAEAEKLVQCTAQGLVQRDRLLGSD